MSREEIVRKVVCSECGWVKHSAEYKYACDACGKALGRDADGNLEGINLHEHHPDSVDAEDYGIVERNFCDWRCLFKWLATVKWQRDGGAVEAVTLPHLYDSSLAEELRRIVVEATP